MHLYIPGKGKRIRIEKPVGRKPSHKAANTVQVWLLAGRVHKTLDDAVNVSVISREAGCQRVHAVWKRMSIDDQMRVEPPTSCPSMCANVHIYIYV